jgi:hypothetical protein
MVVSLPFPGVASEFVMVFPQVIHHLLVQANSLVLRVSQVTNILILLKNFFDTSD